ncbi:Low molecular weight protein-tyrosine-phosphatase YfkJ [bioreactor metagenome]|uniref:protein-tyrosine-phosphatase n=1 Tax=bioreactor metagenome TaxID=1076179 RepID=A0A644ZYM0_9ZZZZ|nr:low molecular weight protein-tyrosine-phosphatase [Candidatus Metalachnospira sp.]
MISLLFVCHGNICRSPMAEFLFKKMITDMSLENSFFIASAAISNEEHGNPVYPPARKKLLEHGIDPSGKKAVKITKEDYNKYDYILAMEESNISGIKRIMGNDSENKIHLLMDYTNNTRDIADPWYTGNFDITYNDILEGLTGFFAYIKSNHKENLK